MKSLFIFVLVALSWMNCCAWDRLGHYTIGELASKHISKATAKKINRLLDGESLAHASVWADFIKSDQRYQNFSSWHYLNMPKGQDDYLKAKKSKSGDIIRAIIYCTNLLRNKKSQLKERKIALKLLIHLVGDLHQPLHIGYNSDRGGNDIKLDWFGKSSSLHMVWDRHLIDLQQMSYTEYTRHLNHFLPGQLNDFSQGTILDWCYESRSFLEAIYQRKNGKYWEFKYNYDKIELLEGRLKRAGIRLANLLEKIFLNRPESKKMLELKEAIEMENLPPLKLP